MKYRIYLAVMLFLKASFSFSQAVPAGTELHELVRISDLYANTPNLSFNLKYTWADSLTWETLTDSTFLTCKLSKGRTFVSNDSIEYLNGMHYNVFVDKADSMVIAYKRQMDESLFQAPLLDSTFQEAHVQSMSITAVNDTTWNFDVVFKPESFYSYYRMVYNPQTALIKSINYHGQNRDGGHDVPEDHVVCAFIYMTHYSDAEIDAVTFNENRYFYLLNGTMYLQTAWEQYDLQTF